MKHSALTADQVRKLQTHVNGLGMTIEEYLKRNGFNTAPLSNKTRTALLATFGKKSGGYQTMRGGKGTRNSYYSGIETNKKSATDDWKIYHHYYKPLFFWQSTENESYKDGILAVLQKQK